MLREYDKKEIMEAWNGCTQMEWCEEIVDMVADLVEQSRFEASKGRMEVLSIAEAAQIIADGRAEEAAREWLVAEVSWDTTTVANAIMAIHEGYRCEQEKVPVEILAWAKAHEDGNR